MLSKSVSCLHGGSPRFTWLSEVGASGELTYTHTLDGIVTLSKNLVTSLGDNSSIALKNDTILNFSLPTLRFCRLPFTPPCVPAACVRNRLIRWTTSKKNPGTRGHLRGTVTLRIQ